VKISNGSTGGTLVGRTTGNRRRTKRAPTTRADVDRSLSTYKRHMSRRCVEIHTCGCTLLFFFVVIRLKTFKLLCVFQTTRYFPLFTSSERDRSRGKARRGAPVPPGVVRGVCEHEQRLRECLYGTSRPALVRPLAPII